MSVIATDVLQPVIGSYQPQQTVDLILVEKGKLTEIDRVRATKVAESTGETLTVVIAKLGMVSEKDLAEALADLYQLPLLATKDYPEQAVLEDLDFSLRFCKERKILPLASDEQSFKVVMADPADLFARSALQLKLGLPLDICVGQASDIDQAFDRLYGGGQSAMGRLSDAAAGGEAADLDDIENLKDMASEAPVIRLVNLMIQRAVETRASDIHIEPFETRLKVRYRIDGVMREVESPPQRLSAAVISRLKIMSKLNIAERRLPQDGRINLKVQGKEIDLRVSTVPTMHGESVVMRILDKGGAVFEFEKLGFTNELLRKFKEVLSMPHGIVLVTGPTGSGKSTTLYTALISLNTPDRKILTVEDPVEYQLEGVNQIQVKPQIDLTFSRALRAIVRQDPDIIMIGEMRDLETAGIAVQSALTGHLVLSTLHTNDAASSITRLLDMGVDDFLLSSTINGVQAQRLVRLLCPHCKEEESALPELVAELRLDRFADGKPVMLSKPVGCDQCGGIGYHGRAAIMEFLVMTDSIRRLVLKRADSGAIQKLAQAEGMLTMFEDGLQKAVWGRTTLEEVMRVTQEQ